MENNDIIYKPKSLNINKYHNNRHRYHTKPHFDNRKITKQEQKSDLKQDTENKLDLNLTNFPILINQTICQCDVQNKPKWTDIVKIPVKVTQENMKNDKSTLKIDNQKYQEKREQNDQEDHDYQEENIKKHIKVKNVIDDNGWTIINDGLRHENITKIQRKKNKEVNIEDIKKFIHQ